MEEKEAFLQKSNTQTQGDFQERFTEWQQRYQQFQNLVDDFRFWQQEIIDHLAALQQERQNLADMHENLLRARQENARIRALRR